MYQKHTKGKPSCFPKLDVDHREKRLPRNTPSTERFLLALCLLTLAPASFNIHDLTPPKLHLTSLYVANLTQKHSNIFIWEIRENLQKLIWSGGQNNSD